MSVETAIEDFFLRSTRFIHNRLRIVFASQLPVDIHNIQVLVTNFGSAQRNDFRKYHKQGTYQSEPVADSPEPPAMPADTSAGTWIKKGLVAMLTSIQSAGVAREVNLRNLFCTG